MRTRLGWALSVLGALIALLGLTAMVLLGPDSRFSTGPHAIETDGIAIVTAPRVISWADLQVDILAEVPVRKPVFVGLGNSVDVQNFVGKTERLEVTGFHIPWKVKTREIKGRSNLPGAPTALDWWIAQSAGLGGTSISTTLPDETVSAVILTVGSTNLAGVEVTFAYGIKGGFFKGVGLLFLGLGVVWFGLLVRRSDLWRDDAFDQDGDGVGDRDGDGDGDEIVYLYVDEDGVEHEISAEEAEQYEVVDEAEVVPPAEDPVPVPRPEPQPEPEHTQPKIPGVLTAAEIAAGAELDPLAPDPQAERVFYVFVDEDGVEHDVTADELADFEIVDAEEEP